MKLQTPLNPATKTQGPKASQALKPLKALNPKPPNRKPLNRKHLNRKPLNPNLLVRLGKLRSGCRYPVVHRGGGERKELVLPLWAREGGREGGEGRGGRKGGEGRGGRKGGGGGAVPSA